jgi:hypothetical protein
MLLFGMSALPAQGAAPSSVQMAPSPRPALVPIKRSSTTVQMGHITGTVIDLTSGAPSAGVAVSVGGTMVWSDTNGNYDHWLPVGTYTVTLALADGQGTPAQDIVNVAVLAEAATVQHLGFHDQQPAPSAPTSGPAQPIAVQPAIAPTAVAANASAAGGVPAVMPSRLPVTSASGSAAWLWLTFGMTLLFVGGLAGFGPVLGGRSAALVLRTHAANSALLRTLLTAPVQAARPASPRAAPASDDLLVALLTANARKQHEDRRA